METAGEKRTLRRSRTTTTTKGESCQPQSWIRRFIHEPKQLDYDDDEDDGDNSNNEIIKMRFFRARAMCSIISGGSQLPALVSRMLLRSKLSSQGGLGNDNFNFVRF